MVTSGDNLQKKSSVSEFGFEKEILMPDPEKVMLNGDKEEEIMAAMKKNRLEAYGAIIFGFLCLSSLPFFSPIVGAIVWIFHVKSLVYIKWIINLVSFAILPLLFIGAISLATGATILRVTLKDVGQRHKPVQTASVIS